MIKVIVFWLTMMVIIALIWLVPALKQLRRHSLFDQPFPQEKTWTLYRQARKGACIPVLVGCILNFRFIEAPFPPLLFGFGRHHFSVSGDKSPPFLVINY